MHIYHITIFRTMNRQVLNIRMTILAGTLLVTTLMMTASSVSAQEPPFNIETFGMEDKKAPFLTVEGTAGEDIPPEGEIFAYVFITSDGIYAVTSHPGIEDSNEVKDDAEWHAHKVQLNDDNPPCITDLSETGKAELDGSTVTVEKTKATEVSAVQTAHLTVEDGEVCVAEVFDAQDEP